MNKGRLILLGVALVAGGGAFFMVASGGDGPVAAQNVIPQKEEAPTVRVLVADTTFERGAPLDSTMTAWVSWPEESVPAHVVTEEDEAFYDDLDRMRARTTIYEGEPIIAAKTIKQGDRSLMAALLTPGMKAVSVKIKGQAAVSGFVLPGDRVDVVMTTNLPEDGPRGKFFEDQATMTMFENVKVIAINNAVAEEGGPNAIVTSEVTLEMRPDQIEDFVDIREGGDLTLVLRSMFDGEVAEEAPKNEIIVMRYGQG